MKFSVREKLKKCIYFMQKILYAINIKLYMKIYIF